MGKFKKGGAAAAVADIQDMIIKGNTENTQDTQDTKDIKNTQDTKDTVKEKYYRFNLKMPLAYKDYLQSAAYKSSSPTKTVTITEYICELIKADMEKNGGSN